MESSNLSFITDNSSLIKELLQTIESLDSTMRAMREEIAFQREKLAKMDAALEGKELEQKRLWALIEAKDEDNRRMGKQMAELLGKVADLTNAIEDQDQRSMMNCQLYMGDADGEKLWIGSLLDLGIPYRELQDGPGLDKAIPCQGNQGSRQGKQGLRVPASRGSHALSLVKNQKLY